MAAAAALAQPAQRCSRERGGMQRWQLARAAARDVWMMCEAKLRRQRVRVSGVRWSSGGDCPTALLRPAAGAMPRPQRTAIQVPLSLHSLVPALFAPCSALDLACASAASLLRCSCLLPVSRMIPQSPSPSLRTSQLPITSLLHSTRAHLPTRHALSHDAKSIERDAPCSRRGSFASSVAAAAVASAALPSRSTQHRAQLPRRS